MKRIILASLLLLVFSCQGQEKVKANKGIESMNKNKADTTPNMKLENLLQKQLELGAWAENQVTDIPTGYVFSKDDIDITSEIIQDILYKNGYKFDSNEFNNKVDKIFRASTSHISHVNLLDKCAHTTLEHDVFDFSKEQIYIIPEKQIISSIFLLPELIDYQKKYPEIAKLENLVKTSYNQGEDEIHIGLWKDEKDLSKQRRFNQQLLISRNKYLFNDDKSQFTWLIANDTNFMESLVTILGYTKDEKLLNWVMEKNYNNADEFVKNHIFVKNCKGELEIREDILKYIEENIVEEKVNYSEELAPYAYLLLQPINENEKSYFTEKEKYKIFAYATNTYDQLFRKYKFLGTTNRGRWNLLGAYYYNNSLEKWGKLKKEFENNNYYNLPNLKNLIEYAEEFDGYGSPD